MRGYKVHIHCPIVDGPWGGGNQFLKMLREKLRADERYTDDWREARVVLFNSNAWLAKAWKIKQQHPEKIIVLRVDGPMSAVRGHGRSLDRAIRIFADAFADGIIFQSEWSRQMNERTFGIKSGYHTVIHNAPDGRCFFRKDEYRPFEGRKIKLAAASWSSNMRKGFSLYTYLDDHLDFSRYEMTFAGNAPCRFRNIRPVAPLQSVELGALYRASDIYVTASRNDPCSNALIEAITAGIPAVALNDGGHPELVKAGGELFSGEDDIIPAIERVAENYERYRAGLPHFSGVDTAARYVSFWETILHDADNGSYRPKALTFSSRLRHHALKGLITCSRGETWLRERALFITGRR